MVGLLTVVRLGLISLIVVVDMIKPWFFIKRFKICLETLYQPGGRAPSDFTLSDTHLSERLEFVRMMILVGIIPMEKFLKMRPYLHRHSI